MKEADRKISEGALFTDFYQLTMAQLYYREGIHENRAQFEYFFRNYPDYGAHKAGYCVNAGLESFIDWMGEARFGEREISRLASHRSSSGSPLFGKDFLGWLLENGNFDPVDISAVPEGRVVHANVPALTVTAPLAIAQLLESAVLNHINYETLVATKASRIKEAARGQLLLEFGMRRAHGKGANAGTRAALIGGADYTSNAGTSYVLGYPPKGTHAHSMVQAFIALGGGELGAFRAYAEHYPDECVLLVDTIDTLNSGIPNAIKAFEELKRKGYSPVGVRLDSGDLAYLSIMAAKMLDEAGFSETQIVLSNQLDELVIWQIITQIENEAAKYGVDPDRLVRRLVYGVGTGLITSEGHSALDGVYKLVAVKKGGEWVPACKVSESSEKTINPALKKAWRIYDERGKSIADLLSLEDEDPAAYDSLVLHHMTKSSMWRVLPKRNISRMEPLLTDIVKDGRLVYEFPSIDDMRKARREDTERLDPGVKRIINPHTYHVSLTEKLWGLKQGLVQSVKKTIEN